MRAAIHHTHLTDIMRKEFFMLANLNDVLIPAQKGRYAVGLFNAVNLELARGIIAAAEQAHSPVIFGSAEVLLPYGPLEEISYFLIPMAKKASVPVVVHLDHGLKKETCIRALELGFTSVMYDCSALPYEENVKEVREMVRIAHSYGASVEAELGRVGDNEGSLESASCQPDPALYYTDPAQAKDFIHKTKADALAVSVGTAHGAYKLPPKLDFERIHTISRTVPVPLVLHGGSGLTDSDFQKAIAAGISKINIFTDINIAAVEAALSSFQKVEKGIIGLIPAEVEAVRQTVAAKIALFGSSQKNLPGDDIETLAALVAKEVLRRLT